jgi:hypothetical protein
MRIFQPKNPAGLDMLSSTAGIIVMINTQHPSMTWFFCIDYYKFLNLFSFQMWKLQEPPHAESRPETRFSIARLNLSEFSADDTLDTISI